MYKIPFNKAAVTKKENYYITKVLFTGVIAVNGPMGKYSSQFLYNMMHSSHVLHAPSYTAAL